MLQCAQVVYVEDDEVEAEDALASDNSDAVPDLGDESEADEDADPDGDFVNPGFGSNRHATSLPDEPIEICRLLSELVCSRLTGLEPRIGGQGRNEPGRTDSLYCLRY